MVKQYAQRVAMEESPYNSLMRVAHRPSAVFVRGQGSWLTDQEGKTYLDFIQGWAVNSLGHCHPAMTRAIAAQAETLLSVGPALYTDKMLQLAAKIVAHSCIDQVFFTNSGAEANEGAIKLARKWGSLHRAGAYEIITLHNGFHGRTLATMSASGKPHWDTLFEPKVRGFTKVPLNDIDAVERAITPQTVAVMLEPIQGEAGVIPASKTFLSDLRELATQRGLLLILDEIQTGIGRTGKLFAHEHFGVEPDIMTLGKGLGGGVPLAALTAKERVCCFEPGEQGGTFNGNALVTAAGAVVFDIVSQPEFLAAVVEKGRYLKSRLADLSQRYGHGEVRGEGLLIGWVLQRDIAGEIASRAFAQGLLLNAPRNNILRFMPALTVNTEEIDRMCAILSDTLNSFS